jgi:hypothetical protein
VRNFIARLIGPANEEPGDPVRRLAVKPWSLFLSA